jgi:pyruvate/2-oxoglutarate dehydrogenase complex dihydrolipoamide dehydrogenase (E3) component
MTISYDAIIIGTGQAGPSLAQRLTTAGMKIAVIERGRFGGTCVNTGCIPTKTMVASAYAAHMARRAAEFGVNITGSVSVDMKRVKARKDQISGRSNSGIETWMKTMANCTVYQDHARFESPHEVAAGDARLTAERIFINVGGRAVVPEIPGIEAVEYLTNSSMMQVDYLPRHLVIIGGSYIGLEFGQMFRRFGSEVTILEAGPRLIAREDEDVSDAVREILELEGIDIRLNAKCTRLAKHGDEIVLSAESGGTAAEVRGSHLLFAIGRRPNTGDLGRVDILWSTTNCVPACPAFGRWETATARVHLLTLHTMIMRLSPPIFWITIHVGSATGFRPMRCTSICRWAARG